MKAVYLLGSKLSLHATLPLDKPLLLLTCPQK
jgi:hypothetical protein